MECTHVTLALAELQEQPLGQVRPKTGHERRRRRRNARMVVTSLQINDER